ncbi:MAG: SGNH/GDSL hydrolase family protein [Pseudomonadota bacterium]
MMKKKFILKFKHILILCLYLPIQAWSFPYSEIYVFGDSLSDTGRLFEAIGVPPAPYSEGRFSDGEVWVEILAKDFLDLSYNPQTNFAWAGATTGTTNVWGDDLPGLQQQVDTYLENTSTADPNGLYVIWAGGNDFLSGVTNPEQAIATAITNLVTAVTKLRQHGAQHILVPHMPDLGKTPKGLASGNSEAMTGLTLAFNQALANNLQSVIQVDIPASLEMITSHETIAPTSANLTNVTEACLDTKALNICETPSHYFYWDDVHPTTVGHQAIALVFYSTVAEPVYKFTQFDAFLDIPLIGNVLGATMYRVPDDTKFELVITGRRLQTATVLQNLISFPSEHQSPNFDPSSGVLHLPIVHVSLGLKFIAKYTAELSLVPETLNDPFTAPLFVLTSAALLED